MITHLLYDNSNFQRSKESIQERKGSQVRARILAVNMACMNNTSIQFAADTLLQCPNWVAMWWVQRFKEGGIDATLVDLSSQADCQR